MNFLSQQHRTATGSDHRTINYGRVFNILVKRRDDHFMYLSKSGHVKRGNNYSRILSLGNSGKLSSYIGICFLKV